MDKLKVYEWHLKVYVLSDGPESPELDTRLNDVVGVCEAFDLGSMGEALWMALDMADDIRVEVE